MLVETSVLVAADAASVWRAVTDWPRHSSWVPLTRVRTLPGPAEGVGARFVGRTGLGPLGFDDLMEVVVWQPPTGQAAGRCEVRKLGRVVRGRAWFTVAAQGEASSVLGWGEEVDLLSRVLTGAAAAALTPLTRRGLTKVLERAAADIAADPRAEGSDR